MSLKCELCGKAIQRGNSVSHAHNVTKRVWKPNLQSVRAVVDGRPRRMRICTRCIKKGLVQKNVRARKQTEVTA